MSTFKTTIWDFDIEVEYEYTKGDKGDRDTPPTPEWVEIYEYKFLGQVPDFEEDVDKSWLEEKIEEAVLEHERGREQRESWLRPYLRAKRMRNRDI